MQHDFILLDRSGSMQSRWTEALSSINSYVKKLADDGVDTGVTLATFDQDIGKLAFNIIRDRITPSTWRPVSNKDAVPRGGTPLNDATGRIVSLARAGDYDRTAIIIMTDGEENSSKEVSTQQAKSMLDDCRSRGWQVIFLGADFNNAVQAASYGNLQTASVSMASGTMRATMANLAGKRAAYGVTGQSINYTEEEKAALGQKGPTA